MKTCKKNKTVLITGSAGFIGFHLSSKLLAEGWRVVGIDCMSDYYDVSLKLNREKILCQNVRYRSIHKNIEDTNVLIEIFEEEKPSFVVHLAAQAGVRYSIENPRDYLNSNIVGTFELLEAARAYPPEHLLIASTSSAYGASDTMPYKETMKADFQMSFYAATKKATENISHSYSHLFDLPITMFRFFTVYGPWGRPDMALFKFTDAVLRGKPIDVYNFGNMKRDFTYIDDLIRAIILLLDNRPHAPKTFLNNEKASNLQSPVAPFRVVNIGNSKPENLLDFILAIEKATGITAKKNFLPIQAGDVPSTWADTSTLKSLTGYSPETNIELGVEKFVCWYRNYYQI